MSDNFFAKTLCSDCQFDDQDCYLFKCNVCEQHINVCVDCLHDSPCAGALSLFDYPVLRGLCPKDKGSYSCLVCRNCGHAADCWARCNFCDCEVLLEQRDLLDYHVNEKKRPMKMVDITADDETMDDDDSETHVSATPPLPEVELLPFSNAVLKNDKLTPFYKHRARIHKFDSTARAAMVVSSLVNPLNTICLSCFRHGEDIYVRGGCFLCLESGWWCDKCEAGRGAGGRVCGACQRLASDERFLSVCEEIKSA